jgi:hypothetical protein
LKRVYIHTEYLHSPHTMRTISRIRINEHDSAEELSSYTEPDSPLVKRESSPYYPTGKFKDQKAESEKNGKPSLPPIALVLMQFGLDTDAATDAHPSSDVLNMSDFPPILEAGTKPIPWERKSGDRKRKLRGEGKACFNLVDSIVILCYTDADTSNKENILELSSSSDAESYPVAIPLCMTPPPGLMSPLPIKRKASTDSISSDGEERKDRKKRAKVIVSIALNPALMSTHQHPAPTFSPPWRMGGCEHIRGQTSI